MSLANKFNIPPALFETIKKMNEGKAEYDAKVKALMAKMGIKSIGELSPEEKKKFFNTLDSMHKAKNEEVELDEAISKSTGHALVHSSSGKIIAKGNKAEMQKKMKELNTKEKESHYVGRTNRGKVGDTFGFGSSPADKLSTHNEEVELDESDANWAKSKEAEKEKRLVPSDRDKLAKIRAMMAKEKKPMRKEEVEEIEEIKDVAKRYLDKTDKEELPGASNAGLSNKMRRKIHNRVVGVNRAMDRTHGKPAYYKEEIEELDEISADVAKRVAQGRDKDFRKGTPTETQKRRMGRGDWRADPSLHADKARQSAEKRGAKDVYGYHDKKEEVELEENLNSKLSSLNTTVNKLIKSKKLRKSYLQNVASGKSGSLIHQDTAKKLLNKTTKEEVELEEEKTMVCKDCGDKFGKPTNETCPHDSHDENGSNWVEKVEEANDTAKAQIAMQMARLKIKHAAEREALAKKKAAMSEETELEESINHLQMAKHHQALAKEHGRISDKASKSDEDELANAHGYQSDDHQNAAKAHLQAHKTGNPKDVSAAKKATRQSLQTGSVPGGSIYHASTSDYAHKDYNYTKLRSGADALRKGLKEEVELDEEAIEEVWDMKLDPITNTLVAAAVTAGAAMYVLDFWFGQHQDIRTPLEKNIEKAEKAGNAKLYHSLIAKYYEDLADKAKEGLKKLRNNPNSFYKKDSKQVYGAKAGDMKKFEKLAQHQFIVDIEKYERKAKEFTRRERSGEPINKETPYYRESRDYNQLFAEAVKKMKENKKKEVTKDDNQVIKSGDKLSGKQEPIEIDPELKEEKS